MSAPPKAGQNLTQTPMKISSEIHSPAFVTPDVPPSDISRRNGLDAGLKPVFQVIEF